ncbi:hypothetical protein Trco_003691 [Trichoderma cornu-damae]|uniref:Uncharacterized protein n=1 Tax=Trichoderma cornu-damae TaxID=654480 RepID=A0A9P8QRD6_9HYPO|nr:hypothetical protein Trco_003691 [Trichoderma cornu-damae]
MALILMKRGQNVREVDHPKLHVAPGIAPQDEFHAPSIDAAAPVEYGERCAHGGGKIGHLDALGEQVV